VTTTRPSNASGSTLKVLASVKFPGWRLYQVGLTMKTSDLNSGSVRSRFRSAESLTLATVTGPNLLEDTSRGQK